MVSIFLYVFWMISASGCGLDDLSASGCGLDGFDSSGRGLGDLNSSGCGMDGLDSSVCCLNSSLDIQFLHSPFYAFE